MLSDGHGHGHEYRWAEMSGTIKLDGAYIGKLQALKGDHSAARPGLSGIARRNTRGVMIDNDISGGGDEAREEMQALYSHECSMLHSIKSKAKGIGNRREMI